MRTVVASTVFHQLFGASHFQLSARRLKVFANPLDRTPIYNVPRGKLTGDESPFTLLQHAQVEHGKLVDN